MTISGVLAQVAALQLVAIRGWAANDVVATISAINFCIQFELSWRLKDSATPYNAASKRCRLCLKEKWHILFKADGATLNRRSEIFNSCMHKSNLLSNLKL